MNTLDPSFICMVEIARTGAAPHLGCVTGVIHSWLNRSMETTGQIPNGNELFTIITAPWGEYMQRALYSHAETLWIYAEQAVETWERSKGIDDKVHKGTAFFFWAVTGLRVHNFDMAFSMMHKAYEQDRRLLGDKRIKEETTPAKSFAMLRAKDSFVEDLVEEQRIRLANYISDYRGVRENCQFTMDTLDKRFLMQVDNWYVTIWFVYCFMRFDYLVKTRRYGLCDSDFGKQYLGRIAGDLCLVLEHSCGKMLGTYFYEITKENGLVPKGKITKEQECDAGMDTVLVIRQLLCTSELNKKSGESVKLGLPIRDLAIAWKIRNHVQHGVKPLDFRVEELVEITTFILRAVFDFINRPEVTA